MQGSENHGLRFLRTDEIFALSLPEKNIYLSNCWARRRMRPVEAATYFIL